MYWTYAEFWRGALIGYALGGLMGALAMWDFYRTKKNAPAGAGTPARGKDNKARLL